MTEEDDYLHEKYDGWATWPRVIAIAIGLALIVCIVMFG